MGAIFRIRTDRSVGVGWSAAGALSSACLKRGCRRLQIALFTHRMPLRNRARGDAVQVVAILGPSGFSIRPDPVVVQVGDSLEWVLSTPLPNRRISWAVYFEDDGPFGPTVSQLSIDTTVVSSTPTGPSPAVSHLGRTAQMTALTPGDHKYGIRAFDSDTGRKLADDDPRVIVRV